ncbi:hypothetical protein O6H91_01G092000 [Diphasiastrum complanatum]|uniref:Uncharacterized protein n=2 Tax=Diphasiastrum complanatum TaxID=34168 RepID=A0ACC2ETD9_DIPCM|nr:hypothetical protein O6H91_01G091800 [Diphasiastrum complanatum]KAJ7569749.1 hypothetical protein O6H91_01G092000 [Diphasiastrum complanatum]
MAYHEFHNGVPPKTKDAPRRSLPFSRINDYLRTSNKPAVKTIQSSDGDVIDCVPIHQQLAFDHPKLKNHKLQKQPSSGTESVNHFTKMGRSNELRQLWHQNGSCPSATVPVRRTTAEGILRAGSLERYGRKFHQPPTAISLSELPQPFDEQGHEHAIAYVNDDQYYGAQASINVWRPTVEISSEFSLSQIWLLAGSFNGDLNSIEAGWQVSPELYGDSNPRLFTYWTSDAYQATGCYNLLCSGFIQLSSDIAIGASISPDSAYNGSQYDIQILIWKDPVTGNWWMKFGDDFLVGYWPTELFSHLTGAATMIQWGGEIVNTQPSGQHTTTQMGSGSFPQKGFSEASYFRNLGYVDASNQLVSHMDLHATAEHPNCYSIQLSNDNDWGDYFYYGGPGRNPNCP